MNKRKRAAEEITASLGHINRQKNVTSARKDDKRRGCGSVILGSAKGQHEREREKLDGWWKETRTREGMTWLTTMCKKKREKIITSWLHCTGTSRLCASGYENNERKQGHKRG